MCGIALIICGVRIDLSSLLPHVESILPQSQQVDDPTFTIGDLEAALQRRGPDHLGSAKVYFQLEKSRFTDDGDSVQLLGSVVISDTIDYCLTSKSEVRQTDSSIVTKPMGEMHFLGATLQLRGITPVSQPLVDDSRNVLVYNGQVFGGLHVDSVDNDTEILMQALGRCCSCHCHEHNIAGCGVENGKTTVPELLSIIKGPWALIYWQDSSNTLWFGRDVFGRRSLLVHWPTSDDKRLLLSSVSPLLPVNNTSDSDVKCGISNCDFWEELSCGIYSIQFNASDFNGCLLGEVRKHEWCDLSLKELIKWDRAYVEPKSVRKHLSSFPAQRDEGTVELISLDKDISDSLRKNVINLGANDISKGLVQPSILLPVHKVLFALRESVRRRTILNPLLQRNMGKIVEEKYVPVAVLFSGGLDSMILAALLDKCLDSCYEIDLLNVSFDGLFAPDRIAAKAGVKELKQIAPSRRWNLVEIDADLLKLASETKHVMSLINPSNTYMDLNIGLALWLAASGDGFITKDSSESYEADYCSFKYISEAKILLVGTGADEQCAGYGRHRTKFKEGGWLRLHEEMKLDMQRIWKRNLGRDDRCIADNGKEARFPFLDEDVIRILLEIPLWEVADLAQPSGRGDKKILREVAELLGIKEAALLPKRAIQFGSRIARESNKKNFGSNRAANQASAGSVVISN